MDALDFSKLLQQVDGGYRSWRKPSLLLFGANDPFVDVKNPQAFLDDKRTNMRLVTASAKVRGWWRQAVSARMWVWRVGCLHGLAALWACRVSVSWPAAARGQGSEISSPHSSQGSRLPSQRRVILELKDGVTSWRRPPQAAAAMRASLCVPAPPVCLLLQLGHQPQEDYPEAIQDTLEAFLAGETDSWPMGKVVASRLTKKDA